jgi:hypothetical protein
LALRTSDNFDEQFEATQTKLGQHNLIEVAKVFAKGKQSSDISD